MYIRRKVFSVLEDEMGQERYFSTNEVLFEGYDYEDVEERIFTFIGPDGNVYNSNGELVAVKESNVNFVEGKGKHKYEYGQGGESLGEMHTEKEWKKIEADRAKAAKAEAKNMQKEIKAGRAKGVKTMKQAKESVTEEMKAAMRARKAELAEKQALKTAAKKGKKLGKAGLIAGGVIGAAGIAGGAGYAAASKKKSRD